MEPGGTRCLPALVFISPGDAGVCVTRRDRSDQVSTCPGEVALTPVCVCVRAELARREEVLRRHLLVKVLYNEKEVSQTDRRALGPDFRVHFGQIFNLRVRNAPQSIRLQVCVCEESCLSVQSACLLIPEGCCIRLEKTVKLLCVCVCVCV